MMIEKKIEELGLVLPEFRPMKSKNLVRGVKSGNILYLSGVGAWRDGKLIQGKVGKDLTAEEGHQAARYAALNLLTVIKHLIGDLDKVKKFIRGFGYINCVPGFKELSHVTNGATDLIVEVYGEEIGKHARASFGVSDLAHNIPFEIIMDVEVKS